MKAIWLYIPLILLSKASTQEIDKVALEKAKDNLYKEMVKRDINNIEVLVNETFIPNNIDMTSELEDLKLEIIQDLAELEQRLKPKKEPQLVRPVFKWGQTARKVYIHLKYSHRFDAPGCLDIYDQKVTINAEGGSSGDGGVEEEEPESESEKDVEEEEEEDGEKGKSFTGSLEGKADGKLFKFDAMCQVADSIFQYLLSLELYENVTSWTIEKGRLFRKKLNY